MSSKDRELYNRTLDYYESHASELFQAYSSAESPLKDTVKAFFKKGDKILDIGCGSGRDLKMLHESAYDAHGLESSKEFIRLAEERYPELSGRIHHGYIPDDLPSPLNTGDWDGIISSAVMQHIPDNLIFDCTVLFQRQLKPGGRLLISVPTEYPVQNNQDTKGRLFKIRPLEEYDHLLQKLGFTLLRKEEGSDSLKRDGIKWTQLVYRKEN